MAQFGAVGSRRIGAHVSHARTMGLFAPRRDSTSPDSFERILIDHSIVPPGRMGELIRAARHQGVSLLQLLAKNGLASEQALFGALATFHELPFLGEADRDFRPCIKPSEIASCLADGWIRLKRRDGRRIIAAAPTDSSLTTLRHLGGSHGCTDPFDAVTTPTAIRNWIERHHGGLLLEHAVRWIADTSPQMSAERRLSRGQLIFALAFALCAITALAALPAISLFAVVFALTSLLFFATALQRLITFACEIGTRRPRPPQHNVSDRDLPVYTVLVPLYREAHLVGEIVTNVLRLDYPRTKLDIKLILEADDDETRAAAAALDLPGCVDIVVVPTAFPRTKPKALNYALTFAQGELVTIYDAEDRPEPHQLKRALAAFAHGGPQLACVQARLSIRNDRHRWLGRQFAIEYAGLFNVIIPGLERLGQPLMLGGTSNHFRTEVLRKIGGWDPFNVTEDADIGMRLARFGFRAGWIDSETIEEAPETLGNWTRQRTRWLRGWIQTYLVHMRQPALLARQLGAVKFISLQLLLVGIVVSALIHPLFIAYLGYEIALGTAFALAGAPVYDALLLVCAMNLLVGYGVSMEIGVLGLYRAKRPHLLFDIALAPFYWMLISFAAYAALFRFAVSPFKWEKTHHRGTGATKPQRSTRPPAGRSRPKRPNAAARRLRSRAAGTV